MPSGGPGIDTPIENEHPIGLIVRDDLDRSRLTVFFRLLLAIPHLIWFFLWSALIVLLAIFAWFAALFTGRIPAGLHRFFCFYIHYATRFFGYLYLVANPYPRFTGDRFESYPVDVRLPDPVRHGRSGVAFRLILGLPAILVSVSLSGGGFSFARTNGKAASAQVTGITAAAALLGWFSSLARGRMPRGLRDAGAYALGYRAQLLGYLLFVTDRYPSADPHALLGELEPPPVHPVHLEGDALALRRSRVTVFFRLPLVVPHVVWFVLWSIPAILAVIVQWFVTLFSGRPAAALHRFLSRYIRYGFHIYAFGSLAANPFPPFTGMPGVYPLDLVLPEPARQSRWRTAFRLVLAIPAFVVASALGSALLATAILTWFAALATGRAPAGLRNLAAWALRYNGQTNAYFWLLTDVYPHSSPLEGVSPDAEEDAEPLGHAVA